MIPVKYAEVYIEVLNKLVEYFAPKKIKEVPMYEVSMIVEREKGWNYLFDPVTGMMTRAIFSPRYCRKFMGRFQIESIESFAGEMKNFMDKPTCRGVKVYVDFSSLTRSDKIEIEWRENESKC